MEMISTRFLTRRQHGAAGEMPSLREQIAEVFRDRARGVDPLTAHARTKAFYRGSGHDWSRALG